MKMQPGAGTRADPARAPAVRRAHAPWPALRPGLWVCRAVNNDARILGDLCMLVLATAALGSLACASAAGIAVQNGTWDVPCPSGKPGACFTPDFVSTTVNFDPPLPKNNHSTVALWFSACNSGAGWTNTGCPCCGDELTLVAKNVSTDAAVLEISRVTGGGWGQALRVSWVAPGPPAPPPPPPPPPRMTPLSIMMFYGFNETAQCGWTTHAWQELGTGQAFKTNLSVALTELVSFHVFEREDGHAGLPMDWGLQLDNFEQTVAPFVHNGSATGIFLGDEKICGGVPLSNYTAVLTHLRAAFGRSVLLYGNECGNTIGDGELPAELDLFSFDVYNAQNDDGASEVALARGIAEKTIFPQLATHQKLLLVPGCYGNTPATCEKAGGSADVCSLDAQAVQVVRKLDGFFAWANSEDRIAGFNPWHFGHRGRQNSPIHDMAIGAVEMPTVLDKLREIGEHIVSGGAR